MKRILLTMLAALAFLQLHAQDGAVVIFSEQGERFTVIMNGLRMNDGPVTNLKVDGLNQEAYKLKLIFEEARLGEMDKNLYVKPGYEVVYMVKQNKKGIYKLAYRSEAPLEQAPPPAPSQVVYHWGAPAPAVTTTTTVVEETTVQETGGTGDNVSMNVNVDGFGMDVNIQTNDGSMNTNMGTSMSTTTTTTTTTTTGGSQWGQAEVVEAAPCQMMDAGSFESARSSIRSKSFADSKMALAKQVTKANCLTSLQAKQIMDLFDFEDDRLEYAKFAYDYVYDPNNYYQVNDAFEFESSIEELDEYISGR